MLGLGVVDSRAVVTHFGSDNRDPTAAYTNTVWKSFNSGLKQGLDVASNVAFNLGDLEAGAVADMRYVYSLRQEAMDTALSTLFGLSIVSPSVAVSGDAAPFVVVADGATTRVDFYVIKDGTETQVCEGPGWQFPTLAHVASTRFPFDDCNTCAPSGLAGRIPTHPPLPVCFLLPFSWASARSPSTSCATARPCSPLCSTPQRCTVRVPST